METNRNPVNPETASPRRNSLSIKTRINRISRRRSSFLIMNMKDKICDFTGLPKNQRIEFFLGQEKLGQGHISNCSTATTRIKEAKSKGITYYDRVIINGKFDTQTLKPKFSDFD